MNAIHNTDRPRYRPQYVLEPREVDLRKVAECLEPLDRVIARLEKLVADKR